MAKKKTTTVTEEEVELTPVQQQLQKQSDERASQFLGEKVENGQVVEKPEEPQEEVKETPTEEVKEEPKEETETIEFDPEQLKREAAQEARKEILAALAGNTQEKTQENVDDYQKFQKGIWEKEKRQPTWTEAAEFIKEKAKAELRAEQEQQQKEYNDKTEKEKQQLDEQNQATNKYVEDTLNELYTTNKLPKIQNKDNPDDYGLRVRKELFNTIIEVNTKRLEAKQPPKTVKEIFYEDFKLPRKQVAGYDAPVNMGRGGYTPDDTEEIDYREIGGPRNTFRSIMQKALGRK